MQQTKMSLSLKGVQHINQQLKNSAEKKQKHLLSEWSFSVCEFWEYNRQSKTYFIVSFGNKLWRTVLCMGVW